MPGAARSRSSSVGSISANSSSTSTSGAASRVCSASNAQGLDRTCRCGHRSGPDRRTVPHLLYAPGRQAVGGRGVRRHAAERAAALGASLRRVNRTVGGYVTGNLLISLVAGTVAAVTLMAVGVPYALPLAVIVAILDLVPLVGATVALAVCGVAALSEGVVRSLIVVVVLLVYQQLENHVMLPVVYGRTVDLSPLAVLVALLIGAEIAGILGALAAIPVAGSISVAAGELVRWRREASLHLSPAVQAGLDADPVE